MHMQLESLVNDIDFKTKTTRLELEEACSDLSPFFVQPVTDALTSAGLTWVLRRNQLAVDSFLIYTFLWSG
jgi:molecular chaperone DnaK (HSP70)